MSPLRPHDYVDPARYVAEVDAVLRSSWLPVCRADQLARPGDRIAITLAGLPVIATRDQTGELHVLANVCAHRGALVVADGPGHGSTLICGYHRWAYRPDGSFVGAPLADGSDLSGACLPIVPHREWQGFVLVNPSADAPPPEDDLTDLAAVIAPWSWDELVTVASRRFESTWNWKIMVENWIECYHHLGTHRTSVEPYQPAHTTQIGSRPGAAWTAMTVDTAPDAIGAAADWMPGITATDARLLSVWAAFPLLLGGAVSRYAFWLQIVPIDTARHDVIWHLLVHPDQADRFGPDNVNGIMAMLEAVHREDMTACERVQIGLASGLLDHFRLTPLEAGIADFQRWVHDKLAPVPMKS